MKLEDGQVSFSGDTSREVHQELKSLFDESWNTHGDYWNWPLVGYVSMSSLQRILNLAWIYDLQIKNSGCILEFGVHFGSSLAQLINLRSIHEPYNYSRHIYGFDTFEGFQGTSENDGAAEDKDFCVTQGYEQHLDKLCGLHERLAPKSHLKKYTLYKGDASSTVDELLEERPDLVVSLVIFDMDIYEPTRDVLQKLKPHFHKGTILVFDEFNCPHFPGETIAAMGELDFSKIEFIQSPYLPFNTICKI